VKEERTVRWLSAAGVKPRLACLLFGLFILLQAQAASASLHKLFHPAAGSQNHHCVVTLLSDGQVEAHQPDSALAASSVLIVDDASPQILLLIALDYRLLPGRAPPSVLP
jgi:hypothetical protein